MNKDLYIISSRKTGGIKIYSDQLYLAALNRSLNAELVANPNPLYLVKLIARSHVVKGFKVITWGPYNILPFCNSTHVPVFHGFPCRKSQGRLVFYALSLSIVICRIFRKSCVSISNYVCSVLEQVFCLNTRVVWNASDFYLFDEVLHEKAKSLEDRYSINSTSSPLIFSYVGRFIDSKFPPACLLSLSRIFNDYPNTFFRSRSDFNISALLKKSITDVNGFEDSSFSRLSSKPMVDKETLIAELSNVDILFSFSSSEPFGLVYLEALYCGCVVVGPPSGGFLEIYSALSFSRHRMIIAKDLSESAIYDSFHKAMHLVECIRCNSLPAPLSTVRHELSSTFSVNRQLTALLG